MHPSIGAPKDATVYNIYLFQTVVYNVKCQETDASDHQYTSLLTYAQLLMIPPQERTGHKKSRYFN